MRRSPLKPGKGFTRRGSPLARSPFVRKLGHERPKRSYTSRLGTAKPQTGSRRGLEQRLASSRAKEVKLRDGFRCRQCRFDGAPAQGILDAGHVYPKGKFPGGKFLAENIVGQCRRHNLLHVSRPECMFLWYEAEHGEGSLAKLHALVLAQPRKQSIEWLREQLEASEAAIREMELLTVA